MTSVWSAGRAPRAVGLLVLLCVATRPFVEIIVRARVEVGGAGMTVGQAWGGVFLVLLVAFLWLSRSGTSARQAGAGAGLLRRAAASPYVIPLLFVAVYLVVTLPRPSSGFALTSAARLATWLLLVVAVERLARTPFGQRAVFAAGYAGATLIVIVIAIAIGANRYGSAYYSEQYDFAVTQEPLGLAAFAVLALAFVFIAILSRRAPILSWTLAGLLTVGIILSFVRVAYVGLLILAGTYVVLGTLRGRRYVWQAGLAALSVFGVAAIVLRGSILTRITEGNSRVDLWRPIAEGTLGHAKTTLIGGGSSFSAQFYEARTGIPGGVWSHNDFLELLATGGIVLLACYLVLLAWMLRPLAALLRDPGQSPAARDTGVIFLSMFVVFACLSFFSGIIFSVASIVMGIVVGLARGMVRTPGHTFLDAPARQRAEPSTGRWHAGEALPGT